jgi:hypothetical protein
MGGSTKRRKQPPAEVRPKSSSKAEQREPSFWDSHQQAFMLVTTVPPVALICAFLPVGCVSTYFVAWTLFNFLPLKKHARSLGGHMLTVYGSWRNIDTTSLEPGSLLHYLAPLALGAVMGVAYRNLLRALRWSVSKYPEATIEALPAAPDPRRPFVRVPLRPQGEDSAGATVASMSPGTGIHLADAPANVHGDKEFTVKVQLPFGMGGAAQPDGQNPMGMVYDEKRSFQAFVSLEAEDAGATAALVRLIATEGGSGGMKGYFAACRDGDDVLLFVDRILPQPGGW